MPISQYEDTWTVRKLTLITAIKPPLMVCLISPTDLTPRIMAMEARYTGGHTHHQPPCHDMSCSSQPQLTCALHWCNHQVACNYLHNLGTCVCVPCKHMLQPSDKGMSKWCADEKAIQHHLVSLGAVHMWLRAVAHHAIKEVSEHMGGGHDAQLGSE